MSENLKRSNPDFSKYDSMRIGELEEILRADAQGPERDDSDVDEILYVMEVLAKKRRQNGIAGKTALEAYQEFQQHYQPMAEDKSKPRRKSNVIPFRRIAAVAASFVLVFSLSITANAFSFRDVWDAVVTWAQETFSFSMGVEVSEPKADNTLEYESLQQVLDTYNIDVEIPTWLPNEYILVNIRIDETPIQELYIAKYSDGINEIKISVKTYLQHEPEQIEQSNTLLEKLEYHGNTFYVFEDNTQIRTAWLDGSYECYISGNISIDTIKLMVQSIGEG